MSSTATRMSVTPADHAARERATGLRHELVEVLSPSTEAWDRGGKFARYRQITSIHHILFIDPERESIEHYQRDDGRWILRALAGQAVLPLESIGVELALEDVFRNLPEPSGSGRP